MVKKKNNKTKSKKGGSVQVEQIQQLQQLNQKQQLPQQVQQLNQKQQLPQQVQQIQKNQSKKNNIILIDPNKPQTNLTKFPKFEYEGGYGFTCVKFTLLPNQSIRADGGAMNYMTNQIQMKTESGNAWGAIGRVFSGSSFFYNIFTNNGNNQGLINFSGINPGNVGCFYIPKGDSFNFVSNSYICSTPELLIETSVRFGGLITGYGITYVKANAANKDGLIWISSFGDVIPITLQNRGDKIRVDNGILLGFHGNVNINTKLPGGFMSTFFSQEGLVSEIVNDDNNPCIIYLESRSQNRYNDYIAAIAKKVK
jgi:uncharacterized protein (AIM24 family)